MSVSTKFPFIKVVGRGMPTAPLTPDILTEFLPPKMKSTIGSVVKYDGNVCKGVHMTLCCIETKGCDYDAIRSYVYDEKGFDAEMEAKGYCFWGSHTVIILGFKDPETEERLRKLDRAGVPEGKTNDRIYHISVPITQKEGVWVKRFDDVDDEKFEFWSSILVKLDNLTGKTDQELLDLTSAPIPSRSEMEPISLIAKK